MTRDLPFLANVRGMTSVTAHRGFRKLRRGHLFGGECSNRSYGEASGPCLGYDVAIGVGSFAFDTQDAAK